jgi:hypothetical protein
MAESADNSAGDGEKAKPEAIKASTGDSANGSGATPPAEPADSAKSATETKPAITAEINDLPVVEAPKLGAGDEEVTPEGAEPAAESIVIPLPVPFVEAASEAPHESATEAGAAAAPSRSSRFALLAASVALAAALGSFVGTMSASGVSQLFHPATSASNEEEFSATVKAMKAQYAELSVLKSNLDAASRSTTSQFSKIADRLDHIDKHSNAAPETTGSIASAAPAQAVPPPAAEPLPPVLDGWMVQDVQNGRALVASRHGGIFDVGTGSFLPGVGRIEAIKRQDGEWIVVTARGTIVSGR